VDIPRQTGLGSHVANVKRRNIVMDAATIFARHRDFLPPDTEVGLSPAKDQEFKATGGPHAAHAVKRFTFAGKSIVQVYTRPDVSPEVIVGLGWMLGSVTDVHPIANLSIDRRLENNPERLAQLKGVVGSSIGSLAEARALARELEFERRFFEKALLRNIEGSKDADYGAMVALYKAILSAPPPLGEEPDSMVDMIATFFEG